MYWWKIYVVIGRCGSTMSWHTHPFHCMVFPGSCWYHTIVVYLFYICKTYFTQWLWSKSEECYGLTWVRICFLYVRSVHNKKCCRLDRSSRRNTTGWFHYSLLCSQIAHNELLSFEHKTQSIYLSQIEFTPCQEAISKTELPLRPRIMETPSRWIMTHCMVPQRKTKHGRNYARRLHTLVGRRRTPIGTECPRLMLKSFPTPLTETTGRLSENLISLIKTY